VEHHQAALLQGLQAVGPEQPAAIPELPASSSVRVAAYSRASRIFYGLADLAEGLRRLR
jgi:hypothetical protein